MLRNTLAVVAGLLAGLAGITVLQYFNRLLFPLPEGLDLNNPQDIARIMAEIPVAAMLGVEVSYLGGSLACGAATGLVARSHTTLLALGLGVLFTIFNIINLNSIPHPFWMAVLTTITFIPVIWLGARLTRRE